MYSYEWDSSTGGYVLTPTPLIFSKEPRPVYYKELDILGFDKHWKYDKNDCFPYMWAEANNYFYRGRLVAKVKGGSCYTAPEIVLIEDPEPNSFPLRFVDIPAMVEKNGNIIEQLAQDTIKKIYNTFVEYQKKVDVFYVAFSGGKDSVVTLDLVQRALPHNSFKVLFGDTGMEFPDTYKTVEEVKKVCAEGEIEFLTSRSQYEPDYTWSKFGPPATVHRWCCSVHKTSPQIIVLRDALGKPDFTGMAFIGVRASESLSRSEYDYVSLGEKHKGQYSCNPILEWNSAELYAYIYLRQLYLNEAYKKGNRRAGCLVCPRAAERNEYMARICYPAQFNALMDKVRDMYSHNFRTEDKLEEFIRNGGWKARKNGRDLPLKIDYKEKSDAHFFQITVDSPKTDWREWIKTIGVIKNDSSPYIIDFRGSEYQFEVVETNDCLKVRYDIALAKKAPLFTYGFDSSYLLEPDKYTSKVQKAVTAYKNAQKYTQLKKHWLDLTGTDSPYAWSNKYGMPILAMVPDAEMSIARKVFGFINSKTKDEESIATAEDYLSKITYADKLSSKSERDKAFRDVFLGDYTILFDDVDEVIDYLKSHVTESPYHWMGSKEVSVKIKEMANANYVKSGYSEAKQVIDNMPVDQLKDYLKKLIEDNIAVGVEIIKGQK